MENSIKEELQPVTALEVIGSMTFAEKLQKYLDVPGRKAAQIARDAGVSPGQISKFRSGQTMPSLSAILRISRTTGIPLEYWLDDEMSEPPQEELTADESRVLWVVRALGLDAEEVLRRISQGGAMGAGQGPGKTPAKPEVVQTPAEKSGPKRDVR